MGDCMCTHARTHTNTRAHTHTHVLSLKSDNISVPNESRCEVCECVGVSVYAHARTCVCVCARASTGGRGRAGWLGKTVGEMPCLVLILRWGPVDAEIKIPSAELPERDISSTYFDNCHKIRLDICFPGASSLSSHPPSSNTN